MYVTRLKNLSPFIQEPGGEGGKGKQYPLTVDRSPVQFYPLTVTAKQPFPPI